VRFEPALRQQAVRAAEGLGVRDARVKEALAELPRHLFLDEALRSRAYADEALPIGFGQTLSRLSTVARMTEALELLPDDCVLEVGTGSGYQAAVLSRLAAEVYTVERIPALALRARRLLHQLGAYNVHVRAGDGAEGWPEAAPFRAILVTAAAREVPARLLEQLAPGGRLVLPVAEGTGQVIRRIVMGPEGTCEEEVLETCHFVPLVSQG
jgi:protein-L-isoaspartate(D-aspartate) O-methyltransferase